VAGCSPITAYLERRARVADLAGTVQTKRAASEPSCTAS
jgi:hypothetical protein